VIGWKSGVHKKCWDGITLPKLIGFLIGAAGLFTLILWSEWGFVLLLDHANLLFHEAGHPIVGLFSERLEPYGGTIGQLTFPCILMIYFWRKGQALSFAGSSLWFFENWLNIARYVADARTMALPLVGGGIHDWNTILGRWGWLEHDEQIAAILQLDAWIGMIAACAWVCYRFGRNRRQSMAYWSDPFLAIKLASDPRFKG